MTHTKRRTLSYLPDSMLEELTINSIVESFYDNPPEYSWFFFRCSTLRQARNGSLLGQHERACLASKSAGCEILGSTFHAGPGYEFEILEELAQLLRKHRLPLTFESPDRLWHREGYPHSRYSPDPVLKVMDIFKGIRLLSIDSPFLSFEENRSSQTERGFNYGLDRRNDEPQRKAKKEMVMPLVLRMKEEGMSQYGIYQTLQKCRIDLSRMTVNRWVRESEDVMAV